MKRQKVRKLKLTSAQTSILRKIKGRRVKNLERNISIGGHKVLHPKTGKPVTASFVNLSVAEATQFHKLERKGLISAFGKTPYFTNFRLTKKGRKQLR